MPKYWNVAAFDDLEARVEALEGAAGPTSAEETDSEGGTPAPDAAAENVGPPTQTENPDLSENPSPPDISAPES